MEAKGSCLGRVPFTSVIGFVLILVGGSVLCGSLYHGMARTDSYMRDHFFPVYSLQYLRIIAVINGAVTIVLAFMIVIFATVVTSATRGRIYRGDRCLMGGRLSAAVFMCSTYAAIVLWLLFLAFLVIPTLCWIMFNSICTMELAHVWHGPGARRPGPDGRVAPSLEELRQRNELSLPLDDTYTARLSYYYPELARRMGYMPISDGSRIVAPGDPRPPLPGIPPFGSSGHRYINRFYDSDFNYVFNLTNYGIYIKPWLYNERLNYREAITSLEEFAGFCDEVAIVGPLFACSLAGAIFVLLGLTLFIGSLSGFYTRLKLTKELTDFKQSIALRSPKNHDHAAYF